MFLYFRSSGARAAKRAMLQKNGTLSYKEFCFFSKLFASVALKNNDTWTIHGSEEDMGSMYMVKKIAPHEQHEPHSCLHGLSYHQQHHKPRQLETIQDIIRSCIELLNDRVGALPERSVSMLEISPSEIHSNRILRRRHSLNFPETNKSPELFNAHPEWCCSHDQFQNKSGYVQESSYCLGSKSADITDVNSFCINILPSNALSQEITSDIFPQCVQSDNYIGPPIPFCNRVETLENGPDVNYFSKDELISLQEACKSFYKTVGETDDILFEDEFRSETMTLPTEKTIYFSADSPDDLFFSNTETSFSEKQINAPCGTSRLYCDSFSREDPAALNIPETEGRELFWEFHVVYSVSYCVPVLFFQVWDSDGKIVPLQELWRIVDTRFQGRLRDDKWSILTQQEHPLLRRPFYFLHPCGTEPLLKILKPSWNPIVSWLMTIGPSIGFNICPLYGQPRHKYVSHKILKKRKVAI